MNINNYGKKMKLFFLLLFFISACAREGDNKLYVDSSHQDTSVVELPEPSVEGEKARFKLTQLAAANEKFFKINDHIVFTGLEEKIKSTKSLKDVQLKVKSHCIVNQDKVLIEEFNKSLNQSIPLIELLPAQVFLHQEDSYPSCGFSFKAEHKEGAAHHFELPQLPIVDYTTSRFIQLFSSSGKIDKPFPYIFMDNISDYWLDTGTQEPMDKLTLICNDFSLSLQIRPQQFIPVSVFPFDTLEEKVKQKINNKKPTQYCRLFGYKNTTLVGVSSVFYLSYSLSPLRVKIDDDLFEGKEKSFYFEIMTPEEERKKNRPDIPLYSYIIRNPHPYEVYVLIEDLRKRKEELLLGFYGLYYKNGASFYVHHKDEFRLGGVQTNRGQTFQKQIEEGTFITLKPNSEIVFSVVLEHYFRLCSSSVRRENNSSIYWLGGIVKYPELKIYQLVSDNTDLIPLSQNIRHQLNTRAGKGFNLLTNYMENENIKDIWFRKGFCNGKIISRSTNPIIELHRYGGKFKTKWIDLTPITQANYSATDFIIGNIIKSTK